MRRDHNHGVERRSRSKGAWSAAGMEALAGLLQPPVPPGGGAAAAAAAEQGLEPGGDDLYDPEDL